MTIVKNNTAENVPSIEAGFLGEKGMYVRIVIRRKYKFEILLNWYKSERGAQDRRV